MSHDSLPNQDTSAAGAPIHGGTAARGISEQLDGPTQAENNQLKLFYSYSLLRMYGRNHNHARFSAPALSLIFGALLYNWVALQHIIIWLSSLLIMKAIILIACHHVARLPADQVKIKPWIIQFSALEVLYGLSWSWILLFADGIYAETIAMIALMIIVALRSAVSGMVQPILLAATLPMTVCLIAQNITQHDAYHMSLVVLFICAQIYFVIVSKRITSTIVAMLGFRAEKDLLIAELEQAKSVSDEARRRAEAANIAKSRFLATMSHELRTPLNAILGFSDILKREMFGPISNPSYRNYAADIHRSGEHLLKLINEILDLSRIEAGRYQLEEDAVQLADIVADCLRLMTLAAHDRGISLEKKIEPNMPPLWADERALRQICLNLISNAVKFTPSGGTITVKAGWTEGSGQYVCVTDTGPGIPEEEIPIILTSFGQGSHAQKITDRGAGLGLPIVQGLVKLHGGNFSLRSTVGEGTSVLVTLPRLRVINPTARGTMMLKSKSPRARSAA